MAPRTRKSAAAAGDGTEQPRRCLVTGGSGFLGRHIVQQLVDSGRWEVTVFDVRAVEGEERVRFIVGDLRDAAQVADACKGELRWLHWPPAWLAGPAGRIKRGWGRGQ